MLDLDEFTTGQLEREVAERKRRHAAGKCSYCLKDHHTRPACKFAARHAGREI